MTRLHRDYRPWALAIVAVFAAGCGGGDDVDGGAGSGGGAGTSTAGTGTAGTATAGTGGTSGSGGGGAIDMGPMPKTCITPMMPLISDFTPVMGATTTEETTFGDFSTTFSGGTFHYPNTGAVPAPMYPLTSDVSEGTWHVSGDVGDFSGMGLYFQDCQLIDASAFKGIQFMISGSIPSPPDGGVATENTVKLNVGTAADTIEAGWINTNAPMATPASGYGRCRPAASQFDGTCASPVFTVPVTATPTEVQVTWAQMIGGRPAATVDPSEITSISFVFPNPLNVLMPPSTPYTIDVVIDDLSFIP